MPAQQSAQFKKAVEKSRNIGEEVDGKRKEPTSDQMLTVGFIALDGCENPHEDTDTDSAPAVRPFQRRYPRPTSRRLAKTRHVRPEGKGQAQGLGGPACEKAYSEGRAGGIRRGGCEVDQAVRRVQEVKARLGVESLVIILRRKETGLAG